MLLVIAILLVLVLIGIARCIVIVPQSNAYVTEWLGVYKKPQTSPRSPLSPATTLP